MTNQPSIIYHFCGTKGENGKMEDGYLIYVAGCLRHEIYILTGTDGTTCIVLHTDSGYMS
jgi:hypothetical protein